MLLLDAPQERQLLPLGPLLKPPDRPKLPPSSSSKLSNRLVVWVIPAFRPRRKVSNRLVDADVVTAGPAVKRSSKVSNRLVDADIVVTAGPSVTPDATVVKQFGLVHTKLEF